jgi:hypothetical protein
VANSEAYSIIKALMEKGLLVIQHREFIEWLYRLRSREDITEAEIKDLLRRADQLEIYELYTSKRLMATLNLIFFAFCQPLPSALNDHIAYL